MMCRKGFAVVMAETYPSPAAKDADGAPRAPFTHLYYIQRHRVLGLISWAAERHSAELFDTRKQAINFIRERYPRGGVGKSWPMYRRGTDRAEGKPPHHFAQYRVMPVELDCGA